MTHTGKVITGNDVDRLQGKPRCSGIPLLRSVQSVNECINQPWNRRDRIANGMCRLKRSVCFNPMRILFT